MRHSGKSIARHTLNNNAQTIQRITAPRYSTRRIRCAHGSHGSGACPEAGPEGALFARGSTFRSGAKPSEQARYIIDLIASNFIVESTAMRTSTQFTSGTPRGIQNVSNISTLRFCDALPRRPARPKGVRLTLRQRQRGSQGCSRAGQAPPIHNETAKGCSSAGQAPPTDNAAANGCSSAGQVPPIYNETAK